MKKLFSDCRLKLEKSVKDGMNVLRFTQPPWGSYLATIVTSELTHDGNEVVVRVPSWFARSIFWISSGLRDYELIYSIKNNVKPHHHAVFYRCIDRKGRTRYLADIGEVDSDAGCTFVVVQEDLEAVFNLLEFSYEFRLENKTE